MRRILRLQDIKNREDPGVDANGELRPLCPICEFPIEPGQVGIRIDQFEVEVSTKSGQDVYQDVHMEDGSSEKLYHFDCLTMHVDAFVIGVDTNDYV